MAVVVVYACRRGERIRQENDGKESRTMRGLGTIINVSAIIAGGILGMLFGKKTGGPVPGDYGVGYRDLHHVSGRRRCADKDAGL